MADITAAPGSVDQLDKGGSTVEWTNINNVLAQDGNTADVTFTNGTSPGDSDWLRTYNYDFSAIPNDATITGVVANVWARVSISDFIAPGFSLLSTARDPIGNVKFITSFSGTNSLRTTGNSTDLWGNSLTPSIVKDVDFGIGVFANSDEDYEDVWLDSITLTVYYNTGPKLPKIYIGGSRKDVTDAWVYVGGSRKNVTGIWICVNGTYKPLV